MTIENYLRKRHIHVTCRFDGEKKNTNWNDNYIRPTWKIYINGGYIGIFWGGAKNYKPYNLLHDILFAIISDCICFMDYSNYKDFCEAFGYNPEDEKSKHIYKEIEDLYSRTRNHLFSSEIYCLEEMLRNEGY